jgi:hypothetical protein
VAEVVINIGVFVGEEPSRPVLTPEQENKLGELLRYQYDNYLSIGGKELTREDYTNAAKAYYTSVAKLEEDHADMLAALTDRKQGRAIMADDVSEEKAAKRRQDFRVFKGRGGFWAHDAENKTAAKMRKKWEVLKEDKNPQGRS